MSNNRVSLHDIAHQLGLSHATISRALHNSPRVGPELRDRIQKTADELGYRPDPMLSALALYRQSKGNVEVSSVIGWINHWPASGQWRGYGEYNAYWTGASKAAEKFGFRLEEFLYNEQIPAQRLEKILRARSVNGLLIPPHPRTVNWAEFHWENYSTVRLGRSLVNPYLHLVASDRFSNSRQAFGNIRARGYRRVGFLTGRGDRHPPGIVRQPGVCTSRPKVSRSASVCVAGVVKEARRRAGSVISFDLRWQVHPTADGILRREMPGG